MPPVVDHAALPPDELAALSRQVARFETLEDVLRWAHALGPAHTITNVIVQDEYTHDVLLAWTRGRVLVFDTT